MLAGDAGDIAWVDDFPIWKKLVDCYSTKASDPSGPLVLSCEHVWTQMVGMSHDAFRNALDQSAEYAVFFLRALVAEQSPTDPNILILKNNSITIPESYLLAVASKKTDYERLAGADLVARISLEIAREIWKSGIEAYPSTDQWTHPGCSDNSSCGHIRFVSADFVVGVARVCYADDVENGVRPIWYWYDRTPPFRSHGWCENIGGRKLTNNPYDSGRAQDGNSLQTFLGFPAFFQYDSANTIYYSIKTGSQSITNKGEVADELRRVYSETNDISVRDILDKAIEPYLEAKEEGFKKRAQAKATLVLSLGIARQHKAYFDPKRFDSGYGVFITLDFESITVSKQHLVNIKAILEQTRRRFQYKVLQVLVAKLLKNVEAQKQELEVQNEKEKRHGRVLAQIQQPLQSIVESLIGAQASVQRVNATLFAPQVSLFSVAPVVEKYFNDNEWVSFGDFSWESAHSEASIEPPQARNAIAAIVLHTLGAEKGGISSAENLYGRMIEELARDSTGGDPRNNLREVCKNFLNAKTTDELTELFFSEGAGLSKLEATLRERFLRFKQVVFTPFKPDSFQWPVLPILLVAFEALKKEPTGSTTSVVLDIQDGQSQKYTVNSIESFLQVTIGKYGGRPKDDLLYAFEKTPPTFPIVLYSHILDFLRGVLGHDEASVSCLKVEINRRNHESKLVINFADNTYLETGRMKEAFRLMEMIIRDKCGAGTRGDFLRPYLVLAERCGGEGITATLDSTSIVITDTNADNDRKRGRFELKVTDDRECLTMLFAATPNPVTGAS